MRDQYRGRGAGDARVIVVLGHPVARVSEALGVLHKVDRVAQRISSCRPVGDRTEIEHREGNGKHSHDDHGISGVGQSRLAERHGHLHEVGHGRRRIVFAPGNVQIVEPGDREERSHDDAIA